MSATSETSSEIVSTHASIDVLPQLRLAWRQRGNQVVAVARMRTTAAKYCGASRANKSRASSLSRPDSGWALLWCPAQFCTRPFLERPPSASQPARRASGGAAAKPLRLLSAITRMRFEASVVPGAGSSGAFGRSSGCGLSVLSQHGQPRSPEDGTAAGSTPRLDASHVWRRAAARAAASRGVFSH